MCWQSQQLEPWQPVSNSVAVKSTQGLKCMRNESSVIRSLNMLKSIPIDGQLQQLSAQPGDTPAARVDLLGPGSTWSSAYTHKPVARFVMGLCGLVLQISSGASIAGAR